MGRAASVGNAGRILDSGPVQGSSGLGNGDWAEIERERETLGHLNPGSAGRGEAVDWVIWGLLGLLLSRK